MIIENLTNPNQEPQEGDILRHIYDTGVIVEKQWDGLPDEVIEDKPADERLWRNRELQDTDWIVPLTDHPQHASFLVYREELRDYPSQADFPNGDRPIRP